MRTVRSVTDEGVKRSVITYDSFGDLLESNRKKDYRTPDMDDRKFYGCNSMQEADQIATNGLPRVGVQAINIAQQRVAEMAGELVRPAYEEFHNTAGSFVDMGRFVEGTPECMVDYAPYEEPGHSNIVCLILNVTYNSGISAKAIKENGMAMFALVEAIETAGRQAEVWTDMNVSGYRYGDGGGIKYNARTAVKLKKAGEPFDVGMFMYALTHESYLRAHIFNAMHSHDEDVRDACGITYLGGYGSCINNAASMDDFPPYSVYIPCIRYNEQAGEFVPAVLRQLGLIK